MKKNNPNQILCFSFLLFLFLLSACTSVPRFTTRHNSPNVNKEINVEDLESRDVLETETGIASFYSDQFNGKITYSGEVYNMFGLSAAHPFYQMGTIIRVTNTANGKSAIIPINDRMPYRPDRIIDLSLGTAQKLDMINVGIIEVKVEVLEWGKGKK